MTYAQQKAAAGAYVAGKVAYSQDIGKNAMRQSDTVSFSGKGATRGMTASGGRRSNMAGVSGSSSAYPLRQKDALAQSLRGAATPGLILVTLLMCLNLLGCSTSKEDVRFEIASQPVIYSDAEILRDPPVVHVRPVTDVTGIKVVMLPLRVTQKMDNPDLTGYSIGKMIWQVWAGLGVFDYMEYVPDAGPFRLDTALRIARSKGADMLVSGYVTHILAGSTVAQSSLAVQVEAYDVSSGIMVWSMAQAATIPRPASNDYILFSTRNRMPADPIYALTQAIAGDMGTIMRDWSQRERIEDEKRQRDEEEQRKREEEEQKTFTEKVEGFFKGLTE
ncbi:hypothetical protein LJC48_04615 [Desulfovibrio sp. OttesenSCG-928-C06]|nr:hypothetical protein [Desulfovibrio sp. OttesenSCG-928-C06]